MCSLFTTQCILRPMNFWWVPSYVPLLFASILLVNVSFLGVSCYIFLCAVTYHISRPCVSLHFPFIPFTKFRAYCEVPSCTLHVFSFLSNRLLTITSFVLKNVSCTSHWSSSTQTSPAEFFNSPPVGSLLLFCEPWQAPGSSCLFMVCNALGFLLCVPLCFPYVPPCVLLYLLL